MRYPHGSMWILAGLVSWGMLLPVRGETAEVGALGRIVPEAGIITLAGPPGATVERILVEPDRWVAAGEPLVVFAGKTTLELELSQARRQRLEVESSGSKAIEIQQATVTQLESGSIRALAVQELQESNAKLASDHAASVLSRLLKAEAATYSANQREERENQAETTRIGLLVARAETARIRAKFEHELILARLELDRLRLQQDSAIQQADLRIALAEDRLEQATLRSPSPGTILEILQREGEKSGGPLIRMADLGRMAVRAQIFQADLLKLTPRMRATVTSKSLPGKLGGTLVSTGRVIAEDGRVAPAMILLDDPAIAARLLNLEVEVRLSDAP